MPINREINVVLIGNPNTGKSTVFNLLTGMSQKVGNYPGVTVDKKVGTFKIKGKAKVNITDLPGTYSLNPNSADEHVVLDFVLDRVNVSKTDLVLFVTDVENIKRTLLLFSQLKDLELPIVLVINMADRIEKKGIQIDVKLLEELLKVKIVLVSAKKATGFDVLNETILDYKSVEATPLFNFKEVDSSLYTNINSAFPSQNIYSKWLKVVHHIDPNLIESFGLDKNEIRHFQHKETIYRHKFINQTILQTVKYKEEDNKALRSRLDKVLLHRVFGLGIFFAILLIIFQSIYVWSSYPMEWIEHGFAYLTQWTQAALPQGVFNDLISQGVIPGLGGVVIFIPQIAFLFFFIAILEESGYMSRVVFITDKIMRKFGLSGKSIVPLISGTACAIPAVMATRNIENWKERLITILVTPFITCSARLPVYLIIISIIIPNFYFAGVSYQAITLLLLYLLGFAIAIISASILNKVLIIKSNNTFVVEMPNYKMPVARNVGITVWNSTKSFVWGAGKIIVAISIILWFLASHGYSDKFNNAKEIVQSEYSTQDYTKAEMEKMVSAYKIENSYIGTFSRSIEPAITPLGYDWKIGIALVSSFAAREVFIGTLATIYSVGEDEYDSIKNKMKKEVKADGSPLFDLATGISLLLFYAFALQCMSTVAIVKKETNGWKWPLIQLFSMSGFAYLVALISYQILK